MENTKYKKIFGLESLISLTVILSLFIVISIIMGFSNAVNTLFNTAYYLLMNVVWYLLALIVVTGAISEILQEFGIVSLFNKIFSPLMKPLYGMPGATSISIFTSFLSDNPAILSLGCDDNYKAYFKKYQLAGLTNIGTAFGMGLIVVVSLGSQKGLHFGIAIAMGVIAVIFTSIIITRLMLHKTKKLYGTTEEALVNKNEETVDLLKYRKVRNGSIFKRLLESILDGGKKGVEIGFSIIPGVLIIGSIVLLLTNKKPPLGYTGSINEGIGLIPMVGDWLSFIFKPLFGITNSEILAVPITALASAGAAISLVPAMVTKGIISADNIAVLTAMSMFYSGYLSTHVSMMDSLGFRDLTGTSILLHTIGGLIAGIIAHFLYLLVSLML